MDMIEVARTHSISLGLIIEGVRHWGLLSL